MAYGTHYFFITGVRVMRPGFDPQPMQSHTCIRYALNTCSTQFTSDGSSGKMVLYLCE